MATQLTFRRGTSEPTQASGLTLGEPAFNTTLNTLHIGRGTGITATWIGAQISGLSTGIAAGLTYQVPTMSAVKDYVASTTSGVATINGLTGAVTLAAGTNIGISSASGSITVTNLGVQTFNGLTGAVQGVSAAVAGTGISVSGATGAVTITNIGVQSFNGNTGAVTGASLGANTFTGLNTFNSGITTAFLYASTGSTFGGTLKVVGGATFDGRVYVGGDLYAYGNFTSNGDAAFERVVTVLGGATFNATAQFTNGLTSSGDIRFKGTATKNIYSNTAPIVITGVSSGFSLSLNRITLPVSASPLELGSASGLVNIVNTFTSAAVPGLRILTDDQDFIGSYGTVIKPGTYASAERTQTLQDASGVIALTSQLMGAVNGTTAATTAVTSFNGRTGAVQGVSAAVAGTGISVSGATGAVTITNTGVQTFNGLTGAVGGVTTSAANTFTAVQTFNSGVTFASTTDHTSAARFASTIVSTGSVTANGGLTASTLDVSGAARTTGDVTVGATLTVNGNFQVFGTLTTVNRTDLNIDDKTITMGRTLANDALADGGGLSLSGTAARTWTWSNTRSSWESNQGVNVASSYGYAVNGTSVLTSSTLGSGVTASSLQSLGTIGTGVWQATAIGATYGGTGLTSYTIGDVLYASGTSSLAKLGTTTAGFLLAANGAGAAPEYKQVLIKDAGAATIATITSGAGTLTATIQYATASLKGVASFDNTNFTVSTGAVTITGVDGGTY